MAMKCVTTTDKGRGMVSLGDIPQASLMHTEEPYAAVWIRSLRVISFEFI